MTIDPRAIAIGLTGPFGSGASTAATILAERMGYKHCRLSERLDELWEKDNPGRPPKRHDLQLLGNQIRREAKNPGKLADDAIKKLEENAETYKKVAFDGIRNIGEIYALKERFSQRFYLFALECPASDRWERIEPKYKSQSLDLADFTADNERDRNQEDYYGQQVQLCVDEADVLLINDKDVTQTALRGKVKQYVDLVTGMAPRYARPEEILMNLAYSAAHGSKCLKRQVGAVLVAGPPNEIGDIVGQGFNENPVGTKACVEEQQYGAKPGTPGKCFRDRVRYESFADLAKRKTRCPNCGKVLTSPKNQEPPWHCHNCGIDLESYFWPERAMSWCTAVHAEVAAIFAAGRRARGTTLYSTTHPCFQCAEKIAQAGIKNVIFTEPYPDLFAAERLQIAKIQIRRFEGVRSGRFDEIFSKARPYVNALGKELQ